MCLWALTSEQETFFHPGPHLRHICQNIYRAPGKCQALNAFVNRYCLQKIMGPHLELRNIIHIVLSRSRGIWQYTLVVLSLFQAQVSAIPYLCLTSLFPCDQALQSCKSPRTLPFPCWALQQQACQKEALWLLSSSPLI